jgi:hypothetical protein
MTIWGTDMSAQFTNEGRTNLQVCIAIIDTIIPTNYTNNAYYSLQQSMVTVAGTLSINNPVTVTAGMPISIKPTSCMPICLYVITTY